MPATYEPITTTTLTSAATTITLSSISSAYTDLRLIICGGVSQVGWGNIRLNSDSGSNYSYTNFTASGSGGSSSSRGSSQTSILAFYSSNTTNPMLYTVDLFSYSNTSIYKTCLVTEASDNNGSGYSNRAVGLWRNTNAVSSITVTAGGGGNWKIDTTATLYGILKA